MPIHIEPLRQAYLLAIHCAIVEQIVIAGQDHCDVCNIVTVLFFCVGCQYKIKSETPNMIHAYNHTLNLVLSIGHIVEKSIHGM